MAGRRLDLDSILENCGPMIRRIAAAFERDRHRAEDLSQDIFLAVWMALPSFRGDSTFKTYVARIANNRAMSHIKRHLPLRNAEQLSDEVPDQAPSPEVQAIDGEQRLKLLEAVQHLPIGLRQVTALALEGFSASEIAEVLGVTANAVSIRMSRAREALRHQLGATHE